ncbi:hypothetical protein [Croceibacterium ferulae]|uniref:hypothetical protein n=1 Tax=Croceibacterium ferulae TaxID=1854641 RepID=UPI000F87A08D|nr:hypothetical protein [Croceibacterium ferulae]
MIHRHLLVQFSVLAATLPAVAGAQDASPVVTLGITGGSLGVGPEIGYRPIPALGFRASANFLKLSHDVDVDDIDYNGDLHLRSYGATADLYPFESAFRLSAGLRISRNRVDLLATPLSPVSIGGTTYSPEKIGSIQAEVRARDVAPTLTIGVARNQSRGFAWSLDAGVMLHGTPRTDNLQVTGELASNPFLQDDLARERAEIEAEIDNYKVYPLVQLAVGYTF